MLAEYNLLSQHYFHEDNFYLQSNAFFATFQTALFTIQQTYGGTGEILNWAFPVVGFIGMIVWIIGLVRVRFLRLRIERRIAELEGSANLDWQERQIALPFKVAHIRYQAEEPTFLKRIPATRIMLLIPVIFLVIWGFLLVRFLGG